MISRLETKLYRKLVGHPIITCSKCIALRLIVTSVSYGIPLLYVYIKYKLDLYTLPKVILLTESMCLIISLIWGIVLGIFEYKSIKEAYSSK